MPQKIKTAKLMLQIMGWLNIAIAIIFIIIFLVAAIFIGSTGQKGAGIGGTIMGSIGFIIGIFMVAFGVVSLYTAKGFENKKTGQKYWV